MLLVFIGTIEQKDIGLFAAQNKYFSSLIIWKYNIPLPGGLLTMTILALTLFSFFFFPFLWEKNKIGVLVVHLGALILLIGGGITSAFSKEGNMVILEKNQSNFCSSIISLQFP